MDKLALQLYCHLVRDFQHLLGDKDFGSKALKALIQSPRKFREYEFPVLGEVPPQRFRAWWQLANFLKRYRFKDDLYTDAELLERSYRSYSDLQIRLSRYPTVRLTTHRVLQEARKVCKGILSLPFETEAYGRFGKRATVGCPLKKSYQDFFLGVPKHFTCPLPLVKDLKKFLTTTSLGKACASELRQNRKKGSKALFTVVDSLTLTPVPKSWKIHRLITPLSVWGLYRSFDLGGWVESCLREHGLDIKRLQTRHRALAREFSKQRPGARRHATTDLTTASESLVFLILNRVLPRFVITQLKPTICKQLRFEVDGKITTMYTNSWLPMGNGATFPLQTLVFYSLIKAVGNLLKVNGVYSVYGDDLIYPSQIHPYVVQIFGDLGIKMNLEKTFVNSCFRESCGGDYYHGIAVRPALFPEESADSMHGKRRLQYLYKVWNALKERWERCEIPNTFRHLEAEIFIHGRGTMYFVPKSFPDTAGFRVSRPPRLPWYMTTHISRVYEYGSQWYRFKCILDTEPPQRRIKSERIYLLTALTAPREPSHVDPKVYRQEKVDGIHNDSPAKYARSSCVHKPHLRWIAIRFLKACGQLGQTARAGVPFDRCKYEALHAAGSPRVKRVQLSDWT